MKEVFYKYLISIKTLNSKIKFILTGDFQQLEPVNDRVDVDYKNSLALFLLCDGNRLQLTKCRRADNETFELCKFENIEKIKTDTFNNKFTFKHICYTHNKRIEINKIIMDKIKAQKIKKEKTNYIEIEKRINDDHSQNVVLAYGVPIIAHVNNKERGIFNNETFKIIGIHNGCMTIQSDNEFTLDKKGNKKYKQMIIRNEDFQSLFYVAFAMTCHSCQGETFNEEFTIHEWERMSIKMKYTALGRATKKEFINII